MNLLSPEKREIEFELEPATNNNDETISAGEEDVMTLKKNMELTGSQEFILDTAI